MLRARRAARRRRCRRDRRVPVRDLRSVASRSTATVIADFVAEHAAGRTPNPCARCNGEIKFGAFLRRADELGIDLVATGHYVRSDRDADGRWHLRRGADDGEGSELHAAHAGAAAAGAARSSRSAVSPKTETRAIAARFGLPVATKPDSQELCFAPAGDAGAFVRGTRARSWCTTGVRSWIADGRVLGEHDGTFAFTVGQRRGLGVALGAPVYVRRDRRRRRTASWSVRGSSSRRRGARSPTACRGWPAARPARGPFEAEVRVRYRGDGRRPRSSTPRRRGRDRGGVPRRRSVRSRPGRAP